MSQAKKQKVDPNQSKGSFKYLWVRKVWGTTKKIGVSQAPSEILALLDPNLAQMAKTIQRGLECQTRPLFSHIIEP